MINTLCLYLQFLCPLVFVIFTITYMVNIDLNINKQNPEA